MVVEQSAPERGNIIWIDFDPRAAHEQGGRRPSLVLSATDYNRVVGLAVVLPITNRTKGYPFEVELPESCQTTGVVLADHVGSKDWRARGWRFIEQAPDEYVELVISHLSRVLG